MLAWWALGLGAIGVAALYVLRLRTSNSFVPTSFPPSVTASTFPAPTTAPSPTPIAFETDAVAAVHTDTFRLAFGVRRIDYRIFDDHAQIIKKVIASLPQAMRDEKQLPRRPAMLPKLLRAINGSDSTREELARLILQDPVLAGNVLKRANSAFYRQQNARVESVERAIVVLGFEGLRAPVAISAMQPVFNLPQGFFDKFASTTWEQAQRSAVAAECYARLHRTGDPFTANLIGLLGGLGRIVMFRIALDHYRHSGNLMPRAEVFIQLIKDHSRALTRAIAANWEMSDSFLSAIDAQIEQLSPSQMTPMAKALYYGELAGALVLLEKQANATRESSLAMLEAQGLDNDTREAVLQAANDVE
jgi:HD-like signal output (HDOD) protein